MTARKALLLGASLLLTAATVFAVIGLVTARLAFLVVPAVLYVVAMRLVAVSRRRLEMAR